MTSPGESSGDTNGRRRVITFVPSALSPRSAEESYVPPAPVRGSDRALDGRWRSKDHEEDLRRRVVLFLASCNVPGLRHLTVKVDGDTVLLSGRVKTFYEKQLATECSRRVAGVIHVVDLVEVVEYAPRKEKARSTRALDQPRPQNGSDDHWRDNNIPLSS